MLFHIESEAGVATGIFSGRLFLPGEEGDTLRAAVEVGDDSVSLTANQQSLGSWPLGDCSFDRVSDDAFRLTLGGEVVFFEPEEPLSFAAVVSPARALAERFRQVQAAAGRPRHAAPGSMVGGSLVSVVEWIKTHRLTAGALVVALLAALVGVAGGLGGDPVEETFENIGSSLAEEPTTTTSSEFATTHSVSTPEPTVLRGTGGPVPAGDVVTVVGVSDGDTFEVRFADGTVEPLRLIGMNAPEGGECMGPEAAAYLTDLIDGRQVSLVADVSDRDQYERLLRYVYLGDLFVNEDLVLQGYAAARRYEPDTAVADTLEAAQLSARQAQVGMWAPTACGPATIAALEVVEVNYDAPGDDNQNLNEEWVVIGNLGDSPVDLTGWILKDESASHRYSFPTAFVLMSGEQATVYTGCGEDFSTYLYWCNTASAVWNNDGDTAFLIDPNGNIHHFWRYGTSATTTTTRATTTTTRATTTTAATTTTVATTTTAVAANCHPSYPDVCIPPPPPDLDCPEIPYRNFRVTGSDPHRFDRDKDGIGCET